MAEEPIQVRILSTSEFIQAVEEEAKNNPEKVRIISSSLEKDPSFLEFGIAEVAAIVAIVEGAFYIGELAKKIYDWVKRGRAKRVVIQTPTRRLEIVATKDLTESEVRKILQHSKEIAA